MIIIIIFPIKKIYTYFFNYLFLFGKRGEKNSYNNCMGLKIYLREDKHAVSVQNTKIRY